MNPAALRGLLLMCLMKMLSKLSERLFSLMEPDRFAWRNATETADPLDAVCDFRNRSGDARIMSSTFTSWLYTIRYLLPVLGGLVSSAWLGHIRVLQLGGHIMLLSTLLMSVSVYLGFVCQPGEPLTAFTWLLLPLFFGLTQPNILHGIFRWAGHSSGLNCTALAALYFTVASVDEYAGLADWLVDGGRSPRLFLLPAPALLFLALSLLHPAEPRPVFVMPTRQRRLRYFQIFSGLILVQISVTDTRSIVYSAELQFYLAGANATDELLQVNEWLTPRLLTLLSEMVVGIAVMLAAIALRRELPLRPRFHAGILLESAVSLALAAFTWGCSSPQPVTVDIVLSAASLLDGVAKGLLLVAAYELGCRIAPADSKAFVLGIMFSVWGLSNLASRLVIFLLETLPAGHPVLHPSAGRPSFHVYHLAVLGALLLCSLYHRLLAFPLAMPLISTEELSDDVAAGEMQPLLSPVESEAGGSERERLLA